MCTFSFWVNHVGGHASVWATTVEGVGGLADFFDAVGIEILRETLRVRELDQLHFQLVLNQHRSQFALLILRCLPFRRFPGTSQFQHSGHVSVSFRSQRVQK